MTVTDKYHNTVVVIMSSYNSSNYIERQIDSILDQEGVNVRLWIRDDGSTDNTVGIIRKYCISDPRVALTVGNNIGTGLSFFEAIHTCTFEGDYFSFSDADDVWNSDKLLHSVTLLQAHESAQPVALSTRLNVVNAELEHISYSKLPRVKLTFSNALVETVTTGMTIVMNRAAYCALRVSRPESAVMHDAWVYLLITAFGRFIYSPYPTVQYRQHDNNVFGTAHSFKKRMLLRWTKLLCSSPFREQAIEFMTLHGSQLDDTKYRLLERYCNYNSSIWTRITFMLNPSVVKQGVLSNLYMRILILLGKQ